MATGAIHTSAVRSTLAIVLGHWSLKRGTIIVALLSHDEIDAIAVTFLHTLAFVSTVAVSAG